MSFLQKKDAQYMNNNKLSRNYRSWQSEEIPHILNSSFNIQDDAFMQSNNPFGNLHAPNLRRSELNVYIIISLQGILILLIRVGLTKTCPYRPGTVSSNTKTLYIKEYVIDICNIFHFNKI